MSLQSRLLNDTVLLAPDNQILFLNSAADPFVTVAAERIALAPHATGAIMLAEDNLASLQMAIGEAERTNLHANNLRHVAFHEYTSHESPATMDVAIMNLLYQPGNSWVLYGLQVAAYALKRGGRLYVVGAKDRGVLSTAKRMQEIFGNVETLAISKGHRVICSHMGANVHVRAQFIAPNPIPNDLLSLVFADGKLDEGTRLLLDLLEVRPTDEALDIGCGAGFIGLHIARLASQGHVTMVDVS